MDAPVPPPHLNGGSDLLPPADSASVATHADPPAAEVDNALHDVVSSLFMLNKQPLEAAGAPAELPDVSRRALAPTANPGSNVLLAQHGGAYSSKHGSIATPTPHPGALPSKQREIDLPSAGKQSAVRLMRCGSCAGCLIGDCGGCKNCLDKPKYGGPGVKKQACVNRRCERPRPVAEVGVDIVADTAHDPSAHAQRAKGAAGVPTSQPHHASAVRNCLGGMSAVAGAFSARAVPPLGPALHSFYSPDPRATFLGGSALSNAPVEPRATSRSEDDRASASTATSTPKAGPIAQPPSVPAAALATPRPPCARAGAGAGAAGSPAVHARSSQLRRPAAAQPASPAFTSPQLAEGAIEEPLLARRALEAVGEDGRTGTVSRTVGGASSPDGPCSLSILSFVTAQAAHVAAADAARAGDARAQQGAAHQAAAASGWAEPQQLRAVWRGSHSQHCPSAADNELELLAAGCHRRPSSGERSPRDAMPAVADAGNGSVATIAEASAPTHSAHALARTPSPSSARVHQRTHGTPQPLGFEPLPEAACALALGQQPTAVGHVPLAGHGSSHSRQAGAGPVDGECVTQLAGGLRELERSHVLAVDRPFGARAVAAVAWDDGARGSKRKLGDDPALLRSSALERGLAGFEYQPASAPLATAADTDAQMAV